MRLKKKVYKPREFKAWRFDRTGETVTGTFLFTTTQILHGKILHRHHVRLTGVRGSLIQFYGTVVLDFALAQFTPGDRVRIRYDGKKCLEDYRGISQPIFFKQFTVSRWKRACA